MTISVTNDVTIEVDIEGVDVNVLRESGKMVIKMTQPEAPTKRPKPSTEKNLRMVDGFRVVKQLQRLGYENAAKELESSLETICSDKNYLALQHRLGR